MMSCFSVNPQIIISEDGSSTLALDGIEETYHSIHGAIAESLHIYINAGLKQKTQSHLSILEIGMGTGLNVLLTILNKADKIIHYTAIEPYPLAKDILHQLNYGKLLQAELLFEQIHAQAWNVELTLSPSFYFQKINQKVEDFNAKDKKFDIIYWDAFCAQVNPELWEVDVLRKASHWLNSEGILITYCAKGSFKRILKQLNFEVEALPGPQGKREITRGIKK